MLIKYVQIKETLSIIKKDLMHFKRIIYLFIYFLRNDEFGANLDF